MEIIYTDNLAKLVTNATLVIDTCVIVDTTKSPEFLALMRRMKGEYNAALVSIPAVKQEVLSVADNKKEYETLKESIKALDVVFLPSAVEDKFEREGMKFSIAMRRSRYVKDPSFVDKLLLAIPYLYRESVEKIFVVTSNHKDVPLDIFDRVGFIARDNGKEFSQVGIYKFNQEKFSKITQKI